MVTTPNTPPGPGVDASGQAVIDPTSNVKDLNEAAQKRQDDLRTQSEFWLLREMTLRAEHEQEMRTKDAEHAKELREKNDARLDAVRNVDVQTSQQQAQDADTRAATLAKTVTDSAEAMRTQVVQSQLAATSYVDTQIQPLKHDLAEVRQWQFEQQGSKAGTAESSTDHRAGISQTWVIIGIVVTGIVGLLGFLVALGALIFLIYRG